MVRILIILSVTRFCVCTEPIEVPDSPHRYRPRARSSSIVEEGTRTENYGIIDAASELERLASTLPSRAGSALFAELIGDIFDRVCDSILEYPELHHDASAVEQMILSKMGMPNSGRSSPIASIPLMTHQLRDLCRRLREKDVSIQDEIRESETVWNTEEDSLSTTESYEEPIFDMD